MFFASDNTGPTHPKILEAIIEASQGYARPYGADPWAEIAVARIRETFEAPEAEVFFVATGTGANSMALGAMTTPWDTIFCHEMAHILIDESNGPLFFAGGAAFSGIAGAHGRMDPRSLAQALERFAPGDVHTPSRGPLSITNVTEAGTLYTLEDMRELTALARGAGLSVHLDGARLANACAALDCSASELSWKVGIDAVSFGGTKNGCMSVEAVVFFDPIHAERFTRQRMRGGHLWSKHRVLSAQMAAYLEDDLWRDLAGRANAAAAHLAGEIEDYVSFVHPCQANMLFVTFPRALHRKLHAAGAQFVSHGNVETGADEEPVVARLVCDWSAEPENTARFANLLKAG